VNRSTEKGRGATLRPGRCFLSPSRDASRGRRCYRCE
jgi:hypothetical protein